MDQQRVVIDRLYSRKRVDITPKNYLSRWRKCLLMGGLVAGAIVCLILWLMSINFTSITISGVIIVAWLIPSFLMYRRLMSVAVKGDTLILNSLKKQSCVTSLRSVKQVKTTSLMGVQVTSLNYKLDGVTRSAFFINRSWVVTETPERLIKKAIQLSKRKRAKHKPGSVLAS